jgi:hypothetical protein
MKKVMFALCFMFGGVVALKAQQNQDTTSNQYRTETQSQYPQDAQSQDQDRERIQSTELPDEVKRSLEGEEYRGWLISGAYKAKGASDQSSMESDTTSSNAGVNRQGDVSRQDDANATGAQADEMYIVELKNGAQTKTVRFGKDGQKIEGMDDETQSGQNSQYEQNQNSDQSAPSNQPDQSSQPNQPDQSSQSDQSSQTPADQSSQTPGNQSTETQSNQSTDSQNDQSTETQTDQSKANEPKQ